MNKRIRKKQQKNINILEDTKKKTLKQKLSNMNKKWLLVVVNIIVLVGVIVFVKVSYAYLYQTLRGQKSYSLKVKGFSLKLDDSSTSENIKIENSVPISDSEGKNTNAYTFSIINEDASDTGYVLYLDDVEIDNEINRMKDTVVKYQLIENGKETVGLVSDLGTNPFRILVSGVIGGNQTNNYSLRFWINETAEIASGQIFNVKIRVIATSKEAIAEGKLVFGDTIVTSDSGITQMTSDELQTYVDKALGNKIKTELDKQAQEYEAKLAETKTNTKKELLNETHPVGSIYITETNTNPSTLFGGTWISYGSGKTLVGFDSSNSNFNAIAKTGGSLNHTHQIAEHSHTMSHTHTINSHTHTISEHTHSFSGYAKLDISGGKIMIERTPSTYWWIARDIQATGGLVHSTPNVGANHSSTVVVGTIGAGGGGATQGSGQLTTNGSSTANTGSVTLTTNSSSSLPPYITVYMWKRTS